MMGFPSLFVDLSLAALEPQQPVCHQVVEACLVEYVVSFLVALWILLLRVVTHSFIVFGLCLLICPRLPCFQNPLC